MQESDFSVKISPSIMLQTSLYTLKKEEKSAIVCIITHPYSLWGGSKQNNVVIGVRNELVKSGYDCITFNFRGVGRSTGTIGDGVDEQEDISEIVKFAREQLQYSQILVIGYSYGGLISLSAAKRLGDLIGMILISYPTGFVNHLPPDFTVEFPLQFIHGRQDDLIPVSRIESILPSFNGPTTLEIISTDHFYNGKESDVGELCKVFLNKLNI